MSRRRDWGKLGELPQQSDYNRFMNAVATVILLFIGTVIGVCITLYFCHYHLYK